MSGASASGGLRAAFSYCVQQLRNDDYHHYLCLLELPPDMRRAAFALRAFSVETCRAMDVASDPKIGLMRLLWWQEAIDKIFANKFTLPTAQALVSVISEHKVSKSWQKRSVEARINDAQREVTEILQTVKELEKYAEDTINYIVHDASSRQYHVYHSSHCHTLRAATATFLIYQLSWRQNMGCWLRKGGS